MTEVLIPSSPAEAVQLFGDGAGTTVIGGGTTVVPEITHGRLDPGRVILQARAGLDAIADGDTVTIGAAASIESLLDLNVEALTACARNVADVEIRGQGTVGGNLCVGGGYEAPRGDLQGCLLALGAQVRSAGAGGERTEPLEDFLAGGAGRLLLDVSYEEADRQTGYAAVWRPHAHHYTILAVSAAKRDGELRVAATGAGMRAVLIDPDDPLAGLELRDDALASAWYRRKLLPVLVGRVLAELEKSR